jgi:hypothetical protein
LRVFNYQKMPTLTDQGIPPVTGIFNPPKTP